MSATTNLRTQARRKAAKAIHLSRDGMRGRPKDWTPQWVVWIGAGEDGVCVCSTPNKRLAKHIAEGLRDVVANLFLGEPGRKHDSRGWVTR